MVDFRDWRRDEGAGVLVCCGPDIASKPELWCGDGPVVEAEYGFDGADQLLGQVDGTYDGVEAGALLLFGARFVIIEFDAKGLVEGIDGSTQLDATAQQTGLLCIDL